MPYKYCFFETNLLDSFLALFQLPCGIWIIGAYSFHLITKEILLVFTLLNGNKYARALSGNKKGGRY
jgi:hypothetical protein